MILQLLEELIFPRRCAGCGMEIEAGLLCRECRKGLAVLHPFPPVDGLDGGLMLLPYEGVIKKAIHAVKFTRDRNMPHFLGEEAGLLLQERAACESVINFLTEAGNLSSGAENNCTEENCGIKPFSGKGLETWVWSGIPTDRTRLRQRGFDLPAVLFEQRAAEFGGVWRQVLCRIRPTLPMYGLSPAERRQNLQESFATVRNVAGKSVLLTDDIFTTGATFAAAAEILKKAGAVSVKGLAFCGSIENLR